MGPGSLLFLESGKIFPLENKAFTQECKQSVEGIWFLELTFKFGGGEGQGKHGWGFELYNIYLYEGLRSLQC